MLDRLPIDSDEWSAFVCADGRATPFHHPEWARMIADCYGLRCFVFVLRKAPGESIVGGVPVIETYRPFSGRRWSSLPFTDVCRPLVERDDEPHLLASLDRERISAGIRSFELDGPLGGFAPSDAGSSVAHVLSLDPDPAVVESRYRSSVRRNIRTARHGNLELRRGDRESDVTDDFYRLQVLTRQRLGLPPQPRRYFSLLWRRILEPGLGSLLFVEVAGTPVAGAVFLRWNGTVVYKYGASDADAWHLRPNNLIFSEAIADACRGGDRVFHFGRTDVGDEGLRRFKLGWGAEEQPLERVVLGAVGFRSSMLPMRMRTVLRHSPAFVGRTVGEALYRYAA